MEKVQNLATAATDCWNAIMAKNLELFAQAYMDSFNAQVSMFPSMIQGGVQPAIDKYSVMSGVKAWKLPGAGGGGYLALVVDDALVFSEEHKEAIRVFIRRPGM